jgi:hypothetical protein
VFRMRNEYDLRIKCEAMSITGRGGPYVFPMRNERHLRPKRKAMPVTGCGGL